MPGTNQAELKARRRRSATQLTGRPLPTTGTGRGALDGPDLDPAVAGDRNQPKEEFEEKDLLEDVVMADRADDGCCARVARYCSKLVGHEATFNLKVLSVLPVDLDRCRCHRSLHRRILI